MVDRDNVSDKGSATHQGELNWENSKGKSVRSAILKQIYRVRQGKQQKSEKSAWKVISGTHARATSVDLHLRDSIRTSEHRRRRIPLISLINLMDELRGPTK